jgi:hypothetical protein
MPANLTTLVHFSASAATKAPNSAALRIIGMVPTLLSRALMSAVVSSRLSRLMISTGVPAGAALGSRRRALRRPAQAPRLHRCDPIEIEDPIEARPCRPIPAEQKGNCLK